MIVGFDVPQRVVHDSLFVARYLLLLVGPIGEFDFVREKVATGHGVPQAEFGTQSFQAFARLLVPLVTLVDLDIPVIVRIACIARNAITRHFLLEVDVGNGRADVMGVKRLFGVDVPDLDFGARGNVGDVMIIPVGVGIAVCSCVDDAPIVIVISVGIERDLLL